MVKKKGYSIIAAILIILIAATALHSAGITWKWGETMERRSDIVFHTYSMNNALELASLYMNVSFDYSVYQACYDTLETFDMSKSEDDFKTALELGVKENLNLYAKPEYRFLTDYKVSIYEYDSVKIETLNPLEIKATARDMFIKTDDDIRKIYITMEKGSNLEKIFKIDCYGIYNKGKEIYINTKATLGEEIKDKVDSWPKGPVDTKPSETDKGNELKSINVGSERDEGNYHIKPVFEEAKVSITYIENRATGKFEGIKYKVTVKLRVTVQDTRTDEQVFPIYDGTKITFAPLRSAFVFNVDENGDVKVESAGDVVWMESGDGGGSGQTEEIITKDKLIGKEEWSDLVKIDDQHLITAKRGQTLKLRKDVYDKAKEMIDAGKNDGVNILILSAYRNYNYQLGIWEDKKTTDTFEHRKSVSAIPGTSQHHWGTDIDFNSVYLSFKDSDEFKWLQTHASNYGFVLEYPESNPEGYDYEPWHWTYKPLSDVMKEKYITENVNLCELENVVKEMYNVALLETISCNINLPFHIA